MAKLCFLSSAHHVNDDVKKERNPREAHTNQHPRISSSIIEVMRKCQFNSEVLCHDTPRDQGTEFYSGGSFVTMYPETGPGYHNDHKTWQVDS